MSAAVIPEPIAQLQLQLNEIRSTRPRGNETAGFSVASRKLNWPGNTVCIPSRVICGWIMRG
jgi:hypothetical protein